MSFSTWNTCQGEVWFPLEAYSICDKNESCSAVEKSKFIEVHYLSTAYSNNEGWYVGHWNCKVTTIGLRYNFISNKSILC